MWQNKADLHWCTHLICFSTRFAVGWRSVVGNQGCRRQSTSEEEVVLHGNISASTRQENCIKFPVPPDFEKWWFWVIWQRKLQHQAWEYAQTSSGNLPQMWNICWIFVTDWESQFYLFEWKDDKYAYKIMLNQGIAPISVAGKRVFCMYLCSDFQLWNNSELVVLNVSVSR